MPRLNNDQINSHLDNEDIRIHNSTKIVDEMKGNYLNWKEELFSNTFEKAFNESYCNSNNREEFLKNLKEQEDYLNFDKGEIIIFLNEQDHIHNIIPMIQGLEPELEFCNIMNPYISGKNRYY